MRQVVKYLLAGMLLLAIGFGTAWIVAKYRASPPPSGEAYHLVPNWPQLPEGLVLGQVAGVDVASKGNVFVFHRAERIWNGEENARVQIFDEDGKFFKEWKGSSLGRPWAVRIAESGEIFVVDGGDQNEFWPDRARVLKLDSEGNILASLGSYGRAPGQFIWPHTIAIGPDGALYVGEVATGMRIQKFAK